MTRGHVILIGLGFLALGALGLALFQLAGLEDAQAGIWAEALLVLIVCGWVLSYALRVVKGDMTFMQMRRRYREGYDAAVDARVKASFEALSAQEQERLLREVGQVPEEGGTDVAAP
ncbi:MAG: DUF3007 family protein [Aphanocapsa feldmannii 288cV]|nr:MAG: DUF3007 family protein [Aphanocapsa feldmannii 288cV]